MKSCLLFLILAAFCIDFIVARSKQYRSDYTYGEKLQGWIRYNEMPETWERARFRCSLEGSKLATPTSNEFLQIMMDIMDCNDAKVIFLGMSAIYSKRDYYSVEGNHLREMPTYWAPGEPNNPGDELCIAMYANGDIADVSCTNPLPYMCFRKEPENPPPLGQCGTIDPGYIFEEATGHCYKIHNHAHTWSTAFMICSAEGGYSAIINSEEERKTLQNRMEDHPCSKINVEKEYLCYYFGVGFHELSNLGVVNTIHGQTLKAAGYENWEDDQPQRFGEHCAAITRSNQKHHDMWCHHRVAFICEMVPWSLQEQKESRTCKDNFRRYNSKRAIPIQNLGIPKNVSETA
ncbi:lectin c-type domain-containing protein [Phthorimaea operculella]|nr:lectin c-type domain-containing protein [Phthorimaea operculella]